MQLVKFLKDYGGYRAGKYQYYDESLAAALIKNGLVEDAYIDDTTNEPEEKPPYISKEATKEFAEMRKEEKVEAKEVKEVKEVKAKPKAKPKAKAKPKVDAEPKYRYRE